MSKETYVYGKRDLFTCQKRPIEESSIPEECVIMRKCQKRPMYMAKEAY
jgi:hypothetical protein